MIVNLYNFHHNFALNGDRDNKHLKINELLYKGEVIATGFYEVVDFLAVLELSLKNKFGIQKSVKFNTSFLEGVMIEREYFVEVTDKHGTQEHLDVIAVQQIVSKLNKLLQLADKLSLYEPVRREINYDEYDLDNF